MTGKYNSSPFRMITHYNMVNIFADIDERLSALEKPATATKDEFTEAIRSVNRANREYAAAVKLLETLNRRHFTTGITPFPDLLGVINQIDHITSDLKRGDHYNQVGKALDEANKKIDELQDNCDRGDTILDETRKQLTKTLSAYQDMERQWNDAIRSRNEAIRSRNALQTKLRLLADTE